MNWRLTLNEIKELLQTEDVLGNYTGDVTGFADLREAGPGDLSFLSGGKYSKYLAESRASVILVPADHQGEPSGEQCWIPVKEPSLELAKICAVVEKRLLPPQPTGIHPSAIIDPGARLAEDVAVGPYCIIGPDVEIGAGTVLDSAVRIDRGARIGKYCRLSHGAVVGWGCQVGDRCRLMTSSVIGEDGFGYHSDQNGHQRMPQIGIVVLEDDVDLGANACVDRARFAETRIGKGTKIDNLVQVGHNNIIGKHNVICAQVGMAGSNNIGDFCVFAGQVGVGGHLKIGSGATMTGQCGVSKDIPAGLVVSGLPARSHKEEMKLQVRMRHLPELFDRVKALEKATERTSS